MTLEQLKAIIDKATPGPWSEVRPEEYAGASWLNIERPDYGPIEAKESDLELIATSRTALPAALALIEKMAEALALVEYALGPAGKSEDEKIAEKKIELSLTAYEAFKKNVGGE